MKRKILLCVIATVLLICAFGVLTACNAIKNEEPKSNVSRETASYFAGESEEFAVSIESGRREKNFIADGKATDVSDFTQITVTPLKSNEFECVEFVISGENDSLTGKIEKSDFGEYTTSIELNFEPKTVTVAAGDRTCEIDLANILADSLSSSDAVNIAKEEFKDRLSDGDEREIYVKLITGDRTTYYYYVSFIGEGVDYYAMLIDPKTGDVITKK